MLDVSMGDQERGVTSFRPEGALTGERRRDASDQEVAAGDLVGALAARDLVAQAKGAIRVLTGCREEAAFQLLTKISRVSDLTMADVAETLMESITAPERLSPTVREPFAEGLELLRRGRSLDGVRLTSERIDHGPW
jgi:ANTAR domain